jgi:hypothetical protein
MNAQYPSFEPDPEARAARRIAVAHRLVEMGLEAAEAVQRLAMAQIARDIEAAEAGEAASDGDAAARGRREDPVAAIERAARTVRLSLALAARLDGEEPVRRAQARGEAKARREAEKAAEAEAHFEAYHAILFEEAEREETVVEAVAEALERAGVGEKQVIARLDAVRERLDEGEWELDVAERPIGAVLAALCEVMDIDADWSVWAGTAWAIEEAQTNARGSPYAAGGAAWVKPPAASEPLDAPPEEADSDPVLSDGSSP